MTTQSNTQSNTESNDPVIESNDLIVNVFLTRHGISTANTMGNVSHIPNNRKLHKCRNAGLAPEGFEQIIKGRHNKHRHYDYILTSPLKRALQTALLTHNEESLQVPIYLVTLLTEFDKYPDCEGIPLEEILDDVDILSYRNYEKLNIEYFWYGNDEKNRDNGFWWNIDFRYNVPHRMEQLKNLLAEPHFANKTIGMYAHGGIFGGLFQIGAHNYQTLFAKFNQRTKQFFEIKPVF